MSGAGGGKQLLEAAAAEVDEGVVGHHRLGRVEAELGEETQPALECAGVRLGILARMQLDVGEATVVVDEAVQIVVAEAAVADRTVAVATVPRGWRSG